jgi:chromosome segregation ATPase
MEKTNSKRIADLELELSVARTACATVEGQLKLMEKKICDMENSRKGIMQAKSRLQESAAVLKRENELLQKREQELLQKLQQLEERLDRTGVDLIKAKEDCDTAMKQLCALTDSNMRAMQSITAIQQRILFVASISTVFKNLVRRFFGDDWLGASFKFRLRTPL